MLTSHSNTPEADLGSVFHCCNLGPLPLPLIHNTVTPHCPQSWATKEGLDSRLGL